MLKKKLIIFFTFFFILLNLVSCKNKTTFDDNDGIRLIDPNRFTNIAELQDKLHSIADNQTPSVVSITTEKTITQQYNNFDPFDFFFKDPFNDNQPRNSQPKKREFKQGGLGSGVIYKKKGNTYYVITNNHVIEGVDSIKVIIDQKRSYKGSIIATDSMVDIAVVKIETTDELTTAKFGDSDKLKAGDFVIAIGNPFGLQGTMTFGIISALGRNDITEGKVNLTNFIQTDAAINPGNSGGALINLDGEVIGINTLIYSQSGGNIGIGFAIPVNIAKKVADQIIESGKVEHGYLGIEFEELDIEKIKTLNLGNIENGMHVLNIFENSPAAKQGIKVGDVILELDGKKLIKSNDLTMTIGNSKPGTKVAMKILRDGKKIDLNITLADRIDMKAASTPKDSQTLENYGMELGDLDKNNRDIYKIPADVNGVVITKVYPQGPAEQVGLKDGDIIEKINNSKVNNITELKKILSTNNNENYFFINRKGKNFIVRMGS